MVSFGLQFICNFAHVQRSLEFDVYSTIHFLFQWIATCGES